MKVLIASNVDLNNSYLKNIVEKLVDYCDVVTGWEEFWKLEQDFEILHIQWPEELFGWKRNLDKNDLDRLIKQIEFWKNKACKIIVTMHNENSHRGESLDKLLYSSIYNHADGIIHLGNHSFNNIHYENSISTVIKHPIYENLLRQNEKKSRDYKRNSIVFLSLGAIRKDEEREFLMNSIYAIKEQGVKAKFIICNYNFSKKHHPLKWQVIKKCSLKLKFYFHKIKNKFMGVELIGKRINENELINKVVESDILIVPRLDTLNSGLVFLGLTFDKIIVGPNIGNIKEELQKFNLPTFEPFNTESCVNAMLEAYRIAMNNNRIVDDELIREYLPDEVARKHYAFYQKIFEMDKV